MTLLTEILKFTGDRFVRLDPEGIEKFARLKGKVFKLEVLVLDKALYFMPNDNGIDISETWDGGVDVTLRGSPIAFAQFGLKQRGVDNRLFQDKRLTIEGDVELAQEFQRLVREFDVDLEEILSHYVGDVAAHQIGRGARALRAWLEDTGESAKLNIREYLEEESRLLAPKWRVSGFLQDVDTLRADVDRLEQRVRRLANLKH